MKCYCFSSRIKYPVDGIIFHTKFYLVTCNSWKCDIFSDAIKSDYFITLETLLFEVVRKGIFLITEVPRLCPWMGDCVASRSAMGRYKVTQMIS